MAPTINTVQLDESTRIIRQVFDTLGADTWTKPAVPAGYKVLYHRVAVINGGRKDSGTGSNVIEGGIGGLGGGWQERFYPDDALAATVAVFVGKGANFQGTGGSTPETVSSFGSLQGVNGSNLILNLDGSAEISPNAPGHGGNGGGTMYSGSNNAVATSLGKRGGNSAVAQGGDVAPYINGLPGENAPYDPINFSGGGGGGGGGGVNGSGQGYGGGNGGNPGGGAGGVGGILTNNSFPGAAGTPGKGAVCVWSYYVAVTT